MQAVFQRLRQKTIVLPGLVVVLMLFGATAYAAISQGYKANGQLLAGSLVGLDSASSNTVKQADSDHPEDLIGVVVPTDTSLLTLTTDKTDVQVATAGQASALVSTVNGDIKAGDKITTSPVKGVGMKAVLSTKVVGVAQGDFNSSTKGATSHDLKDKSGKTKTVSIGEVPVIVGVVYYVAGADDTKTIIPKYLQQLINAISGKKVSPLRIIISGVLLLFTLLAIGIILSGSVRSAIISIGRNPLSQSAVYRSLLHIILACSGILLVTLGAVYLILSR